MHIPMYTVHSFAYKIVLHLHLYLLAHQSLKLLLRVVQIVLSKNRTAPSAYQQPKTNLLMIDRIELIYVCVYIYRCNM